MLRDGPNVSSMFPILPSRRAIIASTPRMEDSALVAELAAAVPATAAAPRHSAVVRVTHWITTLCFFALLVSGIEIVVSHPRFYWGEAGNVLTPALFRLQIPASRDRKS